MIKIVEFCLAIIVLVNVIVSTWNVYFYFHCKRRSENLINFNKMTEGIQPHKNRLKKTELALSYMTAMEVYYHRVVAGLAVSIAVLILEILIKIIKMFIL